MYMTNNVHYSYIEKYEDHEDNKDYNENEDPLNTCSLRNLLLKSIKYNFPGKSMGTTSS